MFLLDGLVAVNVRSGYHFYPDVLALASNRAFVVFRLFLVVMKLHGFLSNCLFVACYCYITTKLIKHLWKIDYRVKSSSLRQNFKALLHVGRRLATKWGWLKFLRAICHLAKKIFNSTVGFTASTERKRHNCFRLESGARWCHSFVARGCSNTLGRRRNVDH